MNHQARFFAVVLSLFFVTTGLGAQSPVVDTIIGVKTVKIRIEKNDRAAINRIFPTKKQIWLNDTIFQSTNPTLFLETCRENAWLLASLEPSADSTYYLALGPLFHWLQFRAADDITRKWMPANAAYHQLRPGKPVRAALLGRLQNQLLTSAENNGHPFARVFLDSFLLDESANISAVLQLVPGPYFVYKPLKINGDVKIPARTVARFLGIRNGEPFNREQVLGIARQLKSLPYLEQYANPSVRFSGGTATVNLFLKKKRAGRFDFIIGLLPQTDAATGDAGKLILTGSLNGAFLNALGQGERITIELERLRVETQKLNIQAAVPYIGGSPFGAEGRLQIFRRDSTWVDALGSFGVQYLLSGANRLSLFAENRSSSLQKVDTVAILNSRQLPPNLDYRQNGLGAELEWTQLDYRFNPRKGWHLWAKGFAGFHQVLRNNQITVLRAAENPDFNFASLYDSLTEPSIRIRPELRAEWYIPVFQRTTVLLSGKSGGIFSKKTVYRNEQYRLGGNKLLRGFDEESIFATQWAVITAEWRLLIGANSYMAVFSDFGYVENTTGTAQIIQRPLGIGAGMNFETPAGIFGISAAVGRLNPGDAMDFRATKFHLGYVSVF